MQELSLFSQLTLYMLLGIMGLICLVIWDWQVKVLRGRAGKNPDGTSDSWHEQKFFYGIAIADIFFACPVNIAGIVLLFFCPQWGYFLLAFVSFWWVWANIMGTSTSLRFEKPKITFNWIIAFPFGTFIGLAYIVWIIVHFKFIFSM
ncbi:hypothetical protein ACFLRW_01020 [Acidobacteriota bacterium]